MDKPPPDKLDVLMDWFLGDAKETTEAQQTSMLQQLGELKRELDSAADESRAEIIGSLQDIQAAVKEESKARSDFMTQWRSLQRNNTNTIINLMMIMIAVCSIVGVAIGAALSLLLLKRYFILT